MRLLSILLLLLVGGCTKEKSEDCAAGLRLNFNFTLHTNDGNRFGPDVQHVRVYLFDQSGLLRHVQEGFGTRLSNDYVMDVNVDPGRYTIIAWGGSDADFFHSFHEGHMNDVLTNDYEPGVTVGKTTLQDFRIFLDYNLAPDLPEDVVPVIDDFDDLYYGAVGTRHPQTSRYTFEPVEVTQGKTTEREIELIRNTNVLKVTVSGMRYLRDYTAENTNVGLRSPQAAAEELLRMWVSMRNARYTYDNAIGEYARLVRYLPQYRSVTDDQMQVDVKVVRLDVDRHRAEPAYLTVENTVTGAMLFPQGGLDIINTLLQAKDPVTGDYIYQNQSDFDRVYEHPIRIVISADFYVRIFVHNWEVITLEPGV